MGLDMSDQDQRDVVVAPARGRGKGTSGSLPKLNLCGDIGLKIGRDGTWYYQGGAIERKGLVKLFASVLRLEEDGYYLVTPVEKVPIDVESLPFLAVEMTRKGRGEAQALTFRTNVEDVVTADEDHPIGFRPGTLGGFIPFVVVRQNLAARLSRSVYYELAALAVEHGGEAGVWSGGAFFPFPAPEPSV
jgi:uncharacterized protein